LLKKAQETHIIDERNVWDTAEDFMLTLIKVPQFSLRLQILDFETSLRGKYEGLASANGELHAACDAIMNSQRVRHLLGLALFAGNFLNGGTARGRADGFAIEALTQLRTVKTSQQDRGDTLVDYIVLQMIRKYQGEMELSFGQGGEADICARAARRKLVDTVAELEVLWNQAKSYRKMAEAQVLNDTSKTKALARHVEILSMCVAELEVLRAMMCQTQLKWKELCTWFRMEEGNQNHKPTDEFFGIWSGYFRDLKQAFETHLKREKAKQDKEREAKEKASLRAATSRRRPRAARSRAGTDMSMAVSVSPSVAETEPPQDMECRREKEKERALHRLSSKPEDPDKDDSPKVQATKSLESGKSAAKLGKLKKRERRCSIANFADLTEFCADGANLMPKARMGRRRTLSDTCFKSREARLASDLAIEAAEELLDVSPRHSEPNPSTMMAPARSERRKTLLAYNVLMSAVPPASRERRNTCTEDIIAAYRNLEDSGQVIAERRNTCTEDIMAALQGLDGGSSIKNTCDEDVVVASQNLDGCLATAERKDTCTDDIMVALQNLDGGSSTNNTCTEDVVVACQNLDGGSANSERRDTCTEDILAALQNLNDAQGTSS